MASIKQHRILFLLFITFYLANPMYAQTWIASPQIVGKDAGGDTISGYVFHDTNQNGMMDEGEAGVSGVMVSNGLDWAKTDENGYYSIAVQPDMNLTVVQPSGWRVPTDHRMVPQFFYIHKEGGTGYEMRYNGLMATGLAPEQVHFPISRDGAAGDQFSCAVLADTQTYSNEQLGWLRDGVFSDILNAGYQSNDCMIILGDVVGDDLDLLERLLELGSTAKMPQWLVPGNHDIDFDTEINTDNSDSWRRIYGPNYYAFEMGNVLFIVLDNVFYPCGEEDFARGRMNCAEDRSPSYNGRLTETQFTWLEGLIENTPEERLIVFNTHIPFVSFADSKSGQHQTDELYKIHNLVEGREALSFSGHTHTAENHAPGQLFDGWEENTGIGPLPFRHVIAGAASGAWYQGDFNVYGVPMALQRMGAPMGYVHIDFDGAQYQDRYVGALLGRDKGQWIGLNTPSFRDWYNAITEWLILPQSERGEIPPYSINDLPDTKILTPEDFEQGVWLTANVWYGSAETVVEAHISNGDKMTLVRTQQGEGEEVNIGAEWADPFAVARQYSVARYAFQSSLGEERAQGIELFRGSSMGPAAPQPQSSIANRNTHLWRVILPELPKGVHTIEVISTDRHGLKFTDKITIEVREERPPRYWRHEMWD